MQSASCRVFRRLIRLDLGPEEPAIVGDLRFSAELIEPVPTKPTYRPYSQADVNAGNVEHSNHGAQRILLQAAAHVRFWLAAISYCSAVSMSVAARERFMPALRM